MKTKIVYVVVGNSSNIYIEQAWCSIWSAKYYNPNCHVAIVADNTTIDNINSVRREGFKELTDEIIDAHVPDGFSNMEKSRWIKTNLRSLVQGDFLYVDTDTLFCGDVSELDEIDCDIAMVKDWHISFNESFYHNVVVKHLKKFWNFTGPYPTNYYNGGGTLCKDTENSRKFYETWHNNWLYSQSKGWPYDQLSLFKTCIDYPSFVTELPGIYNCQITASIQYLHEAKILHFYTANSKLHPFKGTKIFERVRDEHRIAPDVEKMMINSKSLFCSPSSPVSDSETLRFCFTSLYSCMLNMYIRNSIIYRMANIVADAMLKLEMNLKKYAKAFLGENIVLAMKKKKHLKAYGTR